MPSSWAVFNGNYIAGHRDEIRQLYNTRINAGLRLQDELVLRETFDVGSLRSPTRMASVGHTTTHAGSSPESMRCAQKLHFSAVWSSGLMKIAS